MHRITRSDHPGSRLVRHEEQCAPQRFRKMMVAYRRRGASDSKTVARVVELGTRAEPPPSEAHGGPEVYRSRRSPYASYSQSARSEERRVGKERRASMTA